MLLVCKSDGCFGAACCCVVWSARHDAERTCSEPIHHTFAGRLVKGSPTARRQQAGLYALSSLPSTALPRLARQHPAIPHHIGILAGYLEACSVSGTDGGHTGSVRRQVTAPSLCHLAGFARFLRLRTPSKRYITPTRKRQWTRCAIFPPRSLEDAMSRPPTCSPISRQPRFL